MPDKKTKKQRITGRTLRFMLRVAWKERPSLFLVYLLLFVAEFLLKAKDILLPKFLIDELMLIIGGAPLKEHLRMVAIYVILTMVVEIVAQSLENLSNLLLDIMKEWFSEFFEVQLSEQAMKMDFEYTEDPKVLDQMNKAKEGISWYSESVVGVLNCFYKIVSNAIFFAGVVAIIAMYCPLLLPVQLAVLIVVTILNARNNKIQVESFKRLAKSNRVFGYVFWQLSDFRYGKDIRLYESRDMMCGKAKQFSDEQISEWANRERATRKNSWGMDVINALRDGISYFYMGYLAIKKQITVGEFSMCVSSAGELYWSLYRVVEGMQEITKTCSYAHEFLLFMEYPSAMKKGNEKVRGEKHEIVFEHVSFRYPRAEEFVLRDINLTIRSGEHLSIVGLNGAGKTTLIKLLCRLYDVTEGAIYIDGVNIKDYSEDEYRKLFAVVFQDFQLFAFTLKENVAFEDTVEERVEEVLKLSGFYEDAKKLEHGLDTMIYKSFDEDGTELSGGQKQKVAISRALYRNAPIVILDEPTAALDPVAEYDIYRQFHTLVGGKTAIYISHRLSSCRFCDRIAVFADDTVKEYGTHDELVGKEAGIYAKMFAEQAKYYVECAG